MEIHLTKWVLMSHLSRSLKVIRSDTDRLSTLDFLLVIHSINGPVLYDIQDMARYLPQIVNFSHPTSNSGPHSVCYPQIYNGAWAQKTRLMWLCDYQAEKKFDDTFSHFGTIHKCETDRQTDRRTDGQTDRQTDRQRSHQHGKYCSMHSIEQCTCIKIEISVTVFPDPVPAK